MSASRLADVPALEPPAERPRVVVLTGGPGAGKTAVLEVVRRKLCEHVVVLPEAASILFGGGFPRRASLPARRAAQRAIARVQLELERMHREEAAFSVILCDRGTLDGLAYWPGDASDYFTDLGTTREAELARYDAVIHLHVPSDQQGYNNASNPLRIESASEAAQIDLRIAAAWDGHARLTRVASASDFLAKLANAVAAIEAELPACGRAHSPAFGGDPHSSAPELR